MDTKQDKLSGLSPQQQHKVKEIYDWRNAEIVKNANGSVTVSRGGVSLTFSKSGRMV